MQQLSIKRGLILAADGTKLAVNRAATTADGRRVYDRRYPTRKMFAHLVGYSSATDGRAGVERSANDYLVGAHTDLGGALESELHSLAGGSVTGDDVQLSVLPAAQRTAMGALARDRQAGGGVRDRAAHGARARERVVAELRPQPRGAGLAAARPAARS